MIHAISAKDLMHEKEVKDQVFRQEFIAWSMANQHNSPVEWSELPKHLFIGLVERDLLVFKEAKTGDCPPRKMWVASDSYDQWHRDGFRIWYAAQEEV